MSLPAGDFAFRWKLWNAVDREVQKKDIQNTFDEIRSILDKDTNESIEDTLDTLVDDDTVTILVSKDEDPKKLETFKSEFTKKVKKQPSNALRILLTALKAGAITGVAGISLTVIVIIIYLIAKELAKRDNEK